jgi:nitrous oxidase accessory protein
MYSNHNTFTGNLFERNVAGAALMYSEDIELSENTFASCRGFRAYGILLQSMDRVTVQSNLIIDNSRGIFVNNSSQNLIQRNDVVDNDLAIQLNGGSDRNSFLRNNFINNLSELLLDVSDRETRWADDSGGNFWSDHSGYDLDRDGTGDLPFSIQNVFQVMESRTPEVRFYLLSPAARILELAENTLPILNLGDARDPAPLMAPLPNRDVPWDVVPAGRSDSSLAWAGFYLCFVLAPLTALTFKRRGRTLNSNRNGKIGG